MKDSLTDGASCRDTTELVDTFKGRTVRANPLLCFGGKGVVLVDGEGIRERCQHGVRPTFDCIASSRA